MINELKADDFRFARVARFFFECVARVNDDFGEFADAIVINAGMFGADDDAIG